MTDLDLADGRTVVIEPIAPSDGDRLQRFHATLSDETTRRRFFAVHPVLTPAEVRRFTHVDHQDREAFVALADGEIVAVGRFERIPSTSDGTASAAEVAFVTSDAWQGRGIGAALFACLADRARALGITRFVAETMFDNRPMLAMFRHAGLPVTERVREGVVTVEMELGDQP